MGVARVLRGYVVSQVLLGLLARHETLSESGSAADVSIVIFDSSVPIYTGKGVYMSAVAQEFDHDGHADAIETYSRRSLAHGGRRWTLESVRPPAELRLYRAIAVDLSTSFTRVTVACLWPCRARIG